jgi:dTDP-4-amino-4,6-dideoxygalactose transaminase
MSEFIAFHRPSIGEEEIDEVVQTLRSGWLTSGKKAAQFEEDFRAYTGSIHAVAVNSCTAALHLALAAMDIGPGDEVITTPLTFCATVNAILHTGATPVLADVAADGNLDPAAVAACVTRQTRAIIPVHLAGLPCRMSAIMSTARRHKLRVVEDAAHAVGTHFRGKHVGAAASGFSGDAAAYSFYATKNMTTGEGGMFTTNDRTLAGRVRILTLHGISKDAWNRYAENGNWFYRVLEAGFKYNLSDIQAAIGIHQLRRVDGFITRRAEYAHRYTEAFRQIEELEPPPEATEGRHAWHLYMLRLNLDRLRISRDEFIQELSRRGVGTSVHFIPIPMHPFFAPWAEKNRCPHAETLYSRLVSLPLYPDLSEAEVERVIAAVSAIAVENRRPLTIAAGGYSE